MPAVRCALVRLLVVVLFAIPIPPLRGEAHALSGSPSVLPQDRLHFGLANGPSDIGWMTGSGVPWRYRYQYLAGGVNTGKGWETWNTPSGAFATLYMNDSSANGYIPVFSYYELLQSSPSTGSSESDRDYSNLNNASTMNAYYSNFKLLMQKVGAFGKPVVVHVEPDLWGYLEQRAGGKDASTLAASVASSGFAEAAGLPNTAQGFAWTLLKLRDLYGTNAVLAIHASAWGSGIDIASDTSPSVSAVAVADQTAAFLDSAGITSNPYGSTWDLVFNDVDDHDAGWWEAQGADNQYFTHWWDPSNRVLPNFTRYLAWVGEMHARTARPQVVWQVPVGNQYFLTMNNTCGHYQDNLAAYFIGHATDLYQAGLIAVLFGAGNSCQTTNTDASGDGVTNNSGRPTTDLEGYCNACNTNTSVWPDDDGGFLRIFVGRYYAGLVSLGGSLTSGPGTTSCAAGSADTYVLGGDGVVWHKTFNGTAWSGWINVGGNVMSNPAVACQRGTSSIDLLVEGTDHALYHKLWNGSAWGAWENLGGSLTSGPGVTSCAAGTTNVFVLGGDGVVWEKTFSGGAWSGWIRVGGNVTGNPAVACEPGTSNIDLLVEGTDHALYHKLWNGSAWGAWENLGGSLSSSPAADSCASGKADVFVLGGDGVMWRKSFSGSWGGWTQVGGSWSADPGAACQPTTTKIDVFGRGEDSALWSEELAG